MNMAMKRTFYPVGQGAFYGESFYADNCRFNVVYDCGSVSKGVDKVISDSFHKDEDIDILFISHFDSDHVNKIGILKNSVRKIKSVVMPLLSDKHKCILLALYRSLGKGCENSEKIIREPNEFFGGETKIIWIKKVDDSVSEENINQELIDINEIGSSTIDSGVNISFNINGKRFWVYKPYNYENEERYKQLRDILDTEGISIDNLKDINYINNNTKKIRSCYKKVRGNINQNSLVLYSNFSQEKFYDMYQEHDIYMYRRRRCCYFFSQHLGCLCRHHIFNDWDGRFEVGCIYTGDVDLAVIRPDFVRRIKQFAHYLPIGTIQVPHHGSKNGFDINFFEDLDETACKIMSPISFGLSNSYGHPSSMVVGQLVLKGHLPVCVTNDKRDLFIQIFNFIF